MFEDEKCRKAIILALTAMIMSLCGLRSQAQTVSIKNNLLYDATLTPNLGVEIGVDTLWSVGANFGLRPWPRHDNTTRKYRHFLISLEGRRWFKHTGEGHFLGANVLYTHFNVGGIRFPFGMYRDVRHQRKQGDAVAAGPYYGYSWRLADHWNVEVEMGLDVGYAWSNVYDCGHCGTKIGDEDKVFVMPKLGINAVYTINNKK